MDATAVSQIGPGAVAIPQGSRSTRLHAAATELEAVWVGQMLKDARPKGGMLGQSFAANTFQDMLGEALARSAAQRGAFGLADTLERQVQPQPLPYARFRPDGAGSDVLSTDDATRAGDVL